MQKRKIKEEEVKPVKIKVKIVYAMTIPETVMGRIENRKPRRMRKLNNGIHTSTQTLPCAGHTQGTRASLFSSSIKTESVTASVGKKEVKKESRNGRRSASPHQIARDIIKLLAADAGHDASDYVIDRTIDVLKLIINNCNNSC